MKLHPIKLRTATSLLALLALAASSIAATLRVPQDYATIQGAIDAASPNDTILVAAGTYRESVEWRNKDLTIVGEGSASTIINPSPAEGGPGGAAMLTTGLSSASRIEGFTFTGGQTMRVYDDDWSDFFLSRVGGGMANEDSHLTIADSVFRGNAQYLAIGFDGRGGGMRNVRSNVTIVRCLFEENFSENLGGAVASVDSMVTVRDTVFRRGGGSLVYSEGGSAGPSRFIGCTFENDVLGLWVSGNAVTLTNCRFRNFQSSSSVRAVWNDGGALEFVNCEMANNGSSSTDISRLADISGCNILSRGGSLTITNSTIANNFGGFAGAAIRTFGTAITIRNSIVWGNRPSPISWASGFDAAILTFAGSLSIQNSLVQGVPLLPDMGNLDIDPQFVDPAGNDFRLRPSSPAIDAGNSALVATSPFLLDGLGNALDLDGRNRISGAGVDLGAFELVRDTTPPVITVPADISAAATSVLGASVGFTASALDETDGPVSVTLSHEPFAIFAPGATLVTVTAADAAGNTATKQFTIFVGFSWSGVQMPIRGDGSSIFKLNSVIPVKFRLTGASAGIVDLDARLRYQRITGTPGPILDAESWVNPRTGGAGSGNKFVLTDGDYQLNWRTTGLSAGTYRLYIIMADGLERQVDVTLR